MIINPSNAISALRAPLALLFLIQNIPVRLTCVFLAMVSDVVDGYLARRYQYKSKFGAALDPLMDKFFVYFVLVVLFMEMRIEFWEAISMVARDFFLFLFGGYLILTKRWKTFKFHSVRWGKVTTALQFLVIITLTLDYAIPGWFYFMFVLTGLFTFIELLLGELRSSQ